MNKFIVFKLTKEIDYFKTIISANNLKDAAEHFEQKLVEEREINETYIIAPLVDYQFNNGRVKLPQGTKTRIMKMF